MCNALLRRPAVSPTQTAGKASTGELSEALSKAATKSNNQLLETFLEGAGSRAGPLPISCLSLFMKLVGKFIGEGSPASNSKLITAMNR